MNEDHLNLEIRKFLKKIGIKSQQLIEQEIRNALSKEQIKIGSEINLEMQLTMNAKNLSKVLGENISTGETSVSLNLDVTHKIGDIIVIK